MSINCAESSTPPPSLPGSGHWAVLDDTVGAQGKSTGLGPSNVLGQRLRRSFLHGALTLRKLRNDLPVHGKYYDYFLFF